MHFCNHCENMMYVQINSEDANKLVYYCRFCEHKDENIANKSTCVSRLHLKKSPVTYEHFITPYTKLDPTLPRVDKIPCPNASCPCNSGEKEREVICIRYDDANLKYIYLCALCDMIFHL